MSDKVVPMTVALGLTKTTTDGRKISRNHPNPNGVHRIKKKYRSLKSQRAIMLPKLYTAENPHAQNGRWQCPVRGCESAFTRKAGLLMHMGRETGHLPDSLHDEGDGTLSVAGPHDMRASNGAEQSLNQHEQPDLSLSLDQAVRAGLETYEAAKKMGPSGDEYGEQRDDENRGGYL